MIAPTIQKLFIWIMLIRKNYYMTTEKLIIYMESLTLKQVINIVRNMYYENYETKYTITCQSSFSNWVTFTLMCYSLPNKPWISADTIKLLQKQLKEQYNKYETQNLQQLKQFHQFYHVRSNQLRFVSCCKNVDLITNNVVMIDLSRHDGSKKNVLNYLSETTLVFFLLNSCSSCFFFST